MNKKGLIILTALIFSLSCTVTGFSKSSAPETTSKKTINSSSVNKTQ